MAASAFAVLAWLASTCLVAVQAQNYTVTDLGFSPSGGSNSASEAHAVSRNGSSVGTWWPGNSNKGSQYAFLYANGTNLDLGTISGGGNYDYAIAYGIVSTNQIVGQGTGGHNVYHAFLYTNGVMTDIDTTGQSWSSANAISEGGQICGEFTTPGGLIHAFLYTNGAFLDLGTLPGGTYSTAKGINDAGIIVGQSYDSAANTFAFVYSNNVMASLGSLGGNYSGALGINNAGTIVGESWLANGQLRAFMISNSAMTDLGTFGGTNSSASAINSGGEVAGFATDVNEVTHAFVYSGSTMLNLDTVLPANCAFTNLAYAYGINDAGQICGGGVTTNGGYHAFLATPPALSLTCSSNIIITASGPTGAVVSFTLSATGGCSQATVTANPSSGSLFPVGTNTVNVTATDLCGHTNTCSFTVKVNPPVYPPIVLTSPANMTVTATGYNGAVVTFAATATGGCSQPNIVASPASGSMFPIGTTTVTNTAADSCGESTNGTFTVRVNPQPIVLTCPTNMTVTATSTNGAVVNFTATATGGCSQPNIAASPASGSTFHIGTTTVTNTATDSCGNSTNGIFTMTVIPPPPPVNFSATATVVSNQFQTTIQGTAGQHYLILVSTNLVSWTPLNTNTLLSNTTNWVDGGVRTNGSRFYRAITLP